MGGDAREAQVIVTCAVVEGVTATFDEARRSLASRVCLTLSMEVGSEKSRFDFWDEQRLARVAAVMMAIGARAESGQR